MRDTYRGVAVLKRCLELLPKPSSPADEASSVDTLSAVLEGIVTALR